MENLEIFILNLEKLYFKNKSTGEVSHMVRVNYATRVPDEERFVGLAVLECYQKPESWNNLVNYVGKKCNAEFKKIRLKNGFKYSLVSIDNKEI